MKPLDSSVLQRALMVAACCLGLLTSSACKRDQTAAVSQDALGEVRQVRVARVVEKPVGASLTLTGTLAARDQATLSVKVSGRVSAVTVERGSIVRRGQTVARLEQQEYKLRIHAAEYALQQARARLGLPPEGGDDRVDPEQTGAVRQARANLAAAQANRNRVATLFEQGTATPAESEAAEAALNAARSRYQEAVEEIRNRQEFLSERKTELALARRALTDTTVVASFDAIVQERRASVGDDLEAGAPIVTVLRVNPLRFRGEVPESEAANVRQGQQATVTVEGDPGVYAGRVVRVTPTVNEQQQVLVVEAEISHGGNLRPGTKARADIVTDDARLAATVPSSAVVTSAGVEKVIVVNNGKAQEKPVTTGRRGADWIEVLAGVNVGDTVIVEPGNLQSGQPVNVVE